mmetsp:Transcript_31136/g.72414  ORF Transcript_31136/g.72414 Transcript_31136/m.72414 type:complete len:94 (-) Transcript_31136:390-671(-)
MHWPLLFWAIFFPWPPSKGNRDASAEGSQMPHHRFPMHQLPYQVIEGMDIVKKIEAVGSSSGKPSKAVVIVDSGELELPTPEKPTESPKPEEL